MTDKSREQFKDEVDKYFKSLPDKAFELATCPLCSTRKYSIQMFKKKTMRLMHCMCGMVYNGRQVTQSELDKFYKKSAAMSTWVSLKTSEKEYSRQRSKYQYALDYIREIKAKSVLDIGCGTGVFLNILATENRAMRAVGIDPNADSAAAAQSSGITVIKEAIFKYQTDERFDVVSLWGVLEHVKDPKAVIWKAKSLLAENGVIIACVPNHASTAFQHFRRICYSYCPQHLWYFSISTLQHLFKRAELEIESYTTVEAETDALMRYVVGFHPYRDVPEEHILTHYDQRDRKELEDRVLGNESGYKLIVIARPSKCIMQ